MDSLKFLTKKTRPLSITTNKTHEQYAEKFNSTIPRFTIMYAFNKGYFNLIRHLLSNGADPNQVDKLNRTPLIYCAFIRDASWSVSIAQNLLECGADIEKSDNKNLNALHYCCAFNRHKLLELFLNSLDFELLSKLDNNGNSCLHYAVAFRNFKCIRLILNKCKHYNLEKIENENHYGFKPSDMLGLNLFDSSKEIDEKCKLILKNYEKNLLPNRRSFDNIVDIIPLEELQNLSNKKFRPITAPQKIYHSDKEKSTGDKNMKISFSVMTNQVNSIKESKPNRPQSQNIYKLKNNNKENYIESKEKSQRQRFDLNENQLLIDIKEFTKNQIDFSDLCIDKEHIVNPKGIQSIVVIKNYHQQKNKNNIATSSIAKITGKSTNENAEAQDHQHQARIMSSKTQENNLMDDNQVIKPKPQLSSPKPIGSPSLTMMSGRQSRQSFFNGYLVTSQSGILI